MNKKIFKDRAVMRKRMVLALGFIVAKNNGLVKLELMPEEVEY